MADNRVVQVRITGHVQGVGYRAWTDSTARRLDLKGWVRNRIDGSVEALFEGPPGNVENMLKFCERGPRLARVSAVEILKAVAGGHDAFTVLPTK